MEMISSVVIDDEASNRSLIKQLIKKLDPQFVVVDEADGVMSGFELISRIKPQVVFLDIKMADGNGFNLLGLFEKIDFEVVFISAFDSYALQAFEFNALDYVLKPIDAEKFKRTLSKVRSGIENKLIQSQHLKKIVQSYDTNNLIITKIPIHSGNKVLMLSVPEIIYIKSEEGCTLFKTASGEKHLSSKQLSSFEFILEQFPPLVRIHKGTYINLNHMLSYSKGSTCIVEMTDHSEFEVSRRKKGEILETIEKLKVIRKL